MTTREQLLAALSWSGDRLHVTATLDALEQMMQLSNAHTFKSLVEEATEIQRSKGFDTPSSIDETVPLLAKLALVHTEVSEACEEVRSGDKKKLGEELADVVLRAMGIAGGLDIDLEQEVLSKMAVNAGRPWMHGGRRA